MFLYMCLKRTYFEKLSEREKEETTECDKQVCALTAHFGRNREKERVRMREVVALHLLK